MLPLLLWAAPRPPARASAVSTGELHHHHHLRHHHYHRHRDLHQSQWHHILMIIIMIRIICILTAIILIIENCIHHVPVTLVIVTHIQCSQNVTFTHPHYPCQLFATIGIIGIIKANAFALWSSSVSSSSVSCFQNYQHGFFWTIIILIIIIIQNTSNVWRE